MNCIVKVSCGSYYLITNIHGYLRQDTVGTVSWTNDESPQKARIGNYFIINSSAGGSPHVVTNQRELRKLFKKFPNLFEEML